MFACIVPCSWTCIQHGTYTLVPSFVTHKQFLFAPIFPCSCGTCNQHGTYAIAPFFMTNKQFLFLHEELHNVFMLCLLTELLLVCNIADRCKGDHHMYCGSTSSKHLWEHCWGYTTGTKGLQMGKSSHFSLSLYLLWNCSRNSRYRFFWGMTLPEILSYNGIAWNSFGIMWLPEILLYNGIAWKSFVWWVCLKLCKPIVQKNLRPEFLYLSHLLLGVDEVSHSVSQSVVMAACHSYLRWTWFMIRLFVSEDSHKVMTNVGLVSIFYYTNLVLVLGPRLVRGRHIYLVLNWHKTSTRLVLPQVPTRLVLV